MLPRWLTALILIGAALGPRLIMAANTPILTKDGVGYISAARGESEGAAPYRSPLYPAAIRWTTGLIPDPVAAAQTLSIVAGTLFVFLFWLLYRRLQPGRFGWEAFLLAAFQPYLIRYSGDVLTESLYFCLMAALFLCLDRSVRQPLFLPLAGGIGAALCLTRPEGLLPVLAALLLLPGGGVRRRALFLVIGLGCFLPFSSSMGADPRALLSRTYTESLAQMEGEALPRVLPDVADFIRQSPGRFWIKSIRGVGLAGVRLVEALHPAVFLLSLLGLWMLFTGRRTPRGMGAVILSAGLLYLFFAVLAPTKRHLLQCSPPFLLWAAFGTAWILDRVRERKGAQAAILVGISLVCLLKAGFSQREDKRFLKDQGLAIAERARPGRAVLITRSPRLAFYAEARRIDPGDLVDGEGELDLVRLNALLKEGPVFYLGDDALGETLSRMGVVVLDPEPLGKGTSRPPDDPP